MLIFGNEPGLKSEISACGPSVRSRRNAGVFGHSKGVACGARETATNPAQPMAPAVPRARERERERERERSTHPVWFIPVSPHVAVVLVQSVDLAENPGLYCTFRAWQCASTALAY